jgi:hypothetical protein
MTSWHDPHEAVERMPAHLKRDADEAFLARLNGLLATADWEDSVDPLVGSAPLVYIVGAPRSGTTLLSQLTSKYLDIGYVNNLIARFWLRPRVGIDLSRICLGEHARRAISLRSSYGTTADIAGPHEFGYFWRHWLPLDAAASHHLSAEALECVDSSGLRRVLETEILGGFGGTTVFKNVICGFHAGFLTGIHPSSLFVHITRDPLAAASSILHARQARHGSFEAWWSLKPAAMDDVLCPGHPAEEAARQVHHCRREIAIELAGSGVHRLDTSYEALCADPETELRRIAAAVTSLGGRADRVDLPVEPLAPSAGPVVTREFRDEMERYFNQVGTPRTL